MKQHGRDTVRQETVHRSRVTAPPADDGRDAHAETDDGIARGLPWRRMLQEMADRLLVLRAAATARGEPVLARLAELMVTELLNAARTAPKAAPPTPAEKRTRARSEGPRLTARELECLRWCATGKTYWETAIILGVAERTVDFHMRSARRKLGATSNANCVARAILLGLLQVDDDVT